MPSFRIVPLHTLLNVAASDDTEAIDKIKQNSRHYAKRQYTFFNNQFKDIKWYDIDKISFDEIVNDILNSDK